MKTSLILVGTALAGAIMTMPAIAEAQGMPPLPGVKMPSVPGVPSRQPRRDNRSGGDMNAYMQDVMLIAQGIDFTQKDDAAIDAEAETYRQAVDRLASGKYNSIPAQMRQSNDQQMMIHFKQQASDVDGEIDWATLRVTRNAGTSERVATESYNSMMALDMEMDAAALLFPDVAEFQAAKAKTDAWMAKYGSRDAAGDVFEGDAVAAAKLVQMPPATSTDRNLVAKFRTAWGTSGIDRDIMKIHPRGGWGVKRDSAGRVIGRTHDAAIAARDPSDPEKCYLYDFTLLELNGGGVRRSSHSTKRIACENVPA